MTNSHKSLPTLALITSFLAFNTSAASWQDKLSSSASDLLNASSGQQLPPLGSGLSLSSISSLLGAGNSAVSAKSINNATGVLQYCVKNNVVDQKMNSVTDQLKSKLGIGEAQQQPSYRQGLEGLLDTGNKTIDLKSLGNTALGKQLKTKACNLVLKQGQKYLGF